MGLFQNHMMAAAASAATTTYTIDNSCRFNNDDSAYLTRTPDAGNRKTFTISTWFKFGDLTDNQVIFGVTTNTSGSGTYAVLRALSNDRLEFWDYTNGTFNYLFVGARKVRDPGAWYHVVAVLDTTQSTEADRGALYLNGEEVVYASGGDEYPDEDFEGQFNSNLAHEVGSAGAGIDQFFDGYLADFCFIDGTAYSPSDFGETNSEGVWVPKDVSGLTFGTNGFLLDFESSGDLGNDVSGNNNDFTSSGLASTDQMTDTPTDNFCVLNPVLDAGAGHLYGVTLSDGNLKTTLSASALGTRASATMSVNSGKWYWEGKYIGTDGGNNYGHFGVWSSTTGLPTGRAGSGVAGDNEWWISDDGSDNHDNTSSDTGLGNWVTNDIIQIALDMDARKMWFGRNDTYEGDPAAGSGESFSSIGDNIVPIVAGYGGGSGQGNWEVNFGQSSFAHTAPTGFNAVSTANLTTPAITSPSASFQTELYTGNGTAIGSGGKTVTFSGASDMQPDIVWIKNREQSDNHEVYDAARGTTKQLEMNNTNTETTETEGLTTFGSDGFTTGSLVGVNTSGEDYVAWCWSAGNSGASNTAGSINTTTTYVDTDAGISVSTYTGNGSDGATVGHGLGVTPATVWILPRSNGDHHLASNWEAGVSAYSEKMKLNDNEAASSSSGQVTAASSTTFTLGTDAGVNGDTRTYLAYCFAEVVGFSKFGTYTGNGDTDGPFLYCGFKPAWFMIKPADQTDDWIIWDTKRSTYNVANLVLYPNREYGETTATVRLVNFLSNGMKLRGSHGSVNSDGNSYIFAAFAENPFGGDGVAPATTF